MTDVTHAELAADDGATLVGIKLTETGAAHRTAYDKMADLVSVRDFGAVGDGTTNDAAAFAAALAASSHLFLPPGNYKLTSTITLPNDATLIGCGADITILQSTAAVALKYESPPGGDDLIGPRLEHFTLYCTDSGIRINRADGGFDPPEGEEPDPQGSAMQVRMNRLKIVKSADSLESGSVGIELNKCFNAVIDQCEIVGFDTGYKTLGSDICELRGRSRVWQCNTLLDIQKITTWGSGTQLIGLDLLTPYECFLRSSDNHLQVIGCFFEASSARSLTGAVLELEPSSTMIFTGNRFDTPAAYAPDFAVIDGEAGLFQFEGNYTVGAGWGSVDWNGDMSARYWLNGNRQKILVRGNNAAFETPFSTSEPGSVINRRNDLWVVTPDTPGLLYSDYGPDLRVKEGAFVQPNSPGTYANLIRVKDTEHPITGTVNIYVKAKSTVSGQTLLVSREDAGVYVAAVTPVLTTSPAWYTLFSNVSVTDLGLTFNNGDTSPHIGDFLFYEIVVERA